MKEKIALVCQRYGLEVNGGAELHCRQYAERLTEWYDVTVYTTCALDYITWKNEYPAGESTINGVRVLRREVEKCRDMKVFSRQSELVFSSARKSAADEEKWLDLQGPYAPKLVEELIQDQGKYKKIIFFTYLYYITARALASGKMENALLLPTAHDEGPIYLDCFKDVFRAPKGILYNTVEEQAFCEKKFGISQIPSIIAGVGVESPDPATLPDFHEKYGVGRYLLYAGRIDVSKGCDKLFDYFREYKRRNPSDLKLVLLGKAVMDVPKDDDILPLGFVSDEDKFAAMRDSVSLVLASEFESLSMIVLESMLMGRPVLVNGKCMVLRGHCRKSNAGLYFTNFFEFEATANYLLTHPAEYEVMRENAKKYVAENYRWDVILTKVRAMIEAQ